MTKRQATLQIKLQKRKEKRFRHIVKISACLVFVRISMSFYWLNDRHLLSFELWLYITVKAVANLQILKLLFFQQKNNVQYESKNPPWGFWHFPQTVGNFGPNFICLLHVPIYARLQNYIQLSATLTNYIYVQFVLSTKMHTSIINY